MARFSVKRFRLKSQTLLFLSLLMLGSCNQPTDFLDTDGNAYRYSEMKGKWQVVNYWATWCAPCIREIPELIRLNENNENVLVFGVNFDEPEESKVKKEIEKMGITFPVYQMDPYVKLGIARPKVLPTTILVNPAGNVSDVLVGPQTEASLLSLMNNNKASALMKTRSESP